MQQRYRLFRRGWGVFYVEDTATGKPESLGTSDKDEAKRLVHARNEGAKVGGISREIAGAYLKASDPSYLTRTWTDVMDAIVVAKSGDTQARWAVARTAPPTDRGRLRLVSFCFPHGHRVESRFSGAE